MLKKYLSVKWLRLVIPLLLVAVVSYMFWGRPNRAPKTVIPSTSPATNQPATGPSHPSSADSSSPVNQGSSQKSSASAVAAGGQLTLGQAQQFVSNHSPGQNGSGTSEQSTCNTTPGATCYIEFINGSSTKQLDPKIAGSDGSVIWDWDIHSANLTSGSWTIKAVAQLNGQTKSVEDPIRLVIQ